MCRPIRQCYCIVTLYPLIEGARLPDGSEGRKFFQQSLVLLTIFSYMVSGYGKVC